MDKDPHVISREDNMSSLFSVGLSASLDKSLHFTYPTLVITTILWHNRPYSDSLSERSYWLDT